MFGMACAASAGRWVPVFREQRFVGRLGAGVAGFCLCYFFFFFLVVVIFVLTQQRVVVIIIIIIFFQKLILGLLCELQLGGRFDFGAVARVAGFRGRGNANE
jgi:hypothetical protein